MTAVLTSPPASEPVSLDEARAFLRLDGTDEDALIATLIAAARAHVEALTGRALLTQGWRLCRDRWPVAGVMRLSPAPVASVDAVTLFDDDGRPTVLDPARYRTELRDGPARLRLLGGGGSAAAGGLEVDLTAGYGAAPEDVPAPLRQAVRMLLAFWFEEREAGQTGAVTPDVAHGVWACLAPYRVVRL